MLIAKFCVNITFLECHTRSGHIAASLYAKWLHTNSKLQLPSTSLRHPSSNPCHSWQRTQSQTWKLEWSNMPSVTVSVYHNLLKGIRLWHLKQNACWHWISMRENGSSLNFNFISLPNPAVDENCVCQHCLLHRYLQENDAMYGISIYLNFLWMANFLNVSVFFSVHG